MTKWEKKGADAKRSGRYTSAEQAFHSQRGIPQPSKRDRDIGVTFTGKAVEAQQDFMRGWVYGAAGPKQNGPPTYRVYADAGFGKPKSFRLKAQAISFAKRTGAPVVYIVSGDKYKQHIGKVAVAKNPRTVSGSQAPYHVRVPEYDSLSAGQFATVDAARKYVRALYSRGLLYGRSVEISDARGAVIVSKAYNATKRNGRSYPVQGVAPKRYWEPVAGEVVYIGGRRAVIKRVGMDDGTPYVWFTRPIDGTVAMSVQNLKAIARVEEQKANPLPVDRWVSVKARRLPNGRIEIRGKP